MRDYCLVKKIQNRFMDFIALLDHFGTFAFAVSGIRTAARRNFDWFGAYVVGLVTAIGGGTTRDVLLSITPFWMEQTSYLVITGVGLLAFILLGKRLIRMGRTLFIFDTLGLGLFVVTGINKTLAAGFPFWVAIVMGTITGCIGGVIRDVLVNDMPLVFRQDFYALTCVFGGLVYYFFMALSFPAPLVYLLAALTVISSRILAVKYHMHLPQLKSLDD